MSDSYLVIANCQGGGFARALKTLRPRAKVDVLSFANRQATGAIDETLTRVGDYDVVFSQPTNRAIYGKLHNDVIAPRARQFVLYPAIIFRGLHPDEVSVGRENRRLDSPTGGFHSLIALVAFLDKIPPERAARLYNRYVFNSLGYYEEYDRALAFLQQQASRIGYELPIEQWLVHGSFMHNSVHPRIFALASIALMACQKAGLDVDLSRWQPTRIRDSLGLNSCFPVFPAIAEPRGIEGSTEFLKFHRSGADEAERVMKLTDFIAASHAIYAASLDASYESPTISTARAALRDAGLR
jgi:hypothetical protein